MLQAATAAGVSSGAPYRHFSGKAELLNKIARAGFTRLTETLNQPLEEAVRATWALVHGAAQLQLGGMLSFQPLQEEALRGLMRPVLLGGIVAGGSRATGLQLASDLDR